MAPTISAVVATRDRPHDLNRLIEGIGTNDICRLRELVIVDDGGERPVDLDALQAPFPLRLIRLQARRGAMAARNLAVAGVKSGYTAFFDDDAIPVPDWFSSVLSALDAECDAVTGPVLRFDQGLISRARQARYDARYRGIDHGENVSFFAGGNSAIKTDIFKKAGGFSSNDVGGDNSIVEGLRRIGCYVCFLPEAVILHRNGKGMSAAISNSFLAGKGAWTSLDLRARSKRFVTGASFVGSKMDERVVNGALDAINIAGAIFGAATQERR